MTTKSLDRLLSAMDALPGRRAVMTEWRSRLGAATDDLAPFLRPTNEMAKAWECESPGGDGCPCRVVTHAPDDIVAVCQDSPRRREPVPLTRADLVVHRLDLDAFARSLASGMGLAPAQVEKFPSADAPAWLTENGAIFRLGDRVFGLESVGFYLSLTGSPSTLAQLLPKVRRRDRSNAAAILVPNAGRAQLHVHEMLDGAEITLLGLNRTAAIRSAGRVTVDLADFVLEKKFAGVAPEDYLWPKYHLILDPARGRYYYAGQRLRFKARTEIPQRLLVALAHKAERFVSRADLCAAGWPDEFNAVGSSDVLWDRRVRGHKQTLGRAITHAAEGISGVLPDPIQSVPSGSDLDGGYRLDLPESKIAWWSAPIDAPI